MKPIYFCLQNFFNEIVYFDEITRSLVKRKKMCRYNVVNYKYNYFLINMKFNCKIHREKNIFNYTRIPNYMFSAQILERKHGIIVLVYHFGLLFISERINRSRARILLKFKHLYNLLDLQYYNIIMVVFIK